MKKKFLLTVKATVFFSFLGFLLQGNFLFASSQPNELDLKKIKVNININNATFEDALKQIENKTDFKFFYVKGEIPSTEKVTINETGKSLYDLLTGFAGQYNLNFQRINNQIVIKKNRIANTSTGIIKGENGAIKGKVTDAKTGKPLVDANIFIKGTKSGTTSDKSGNYQIEKLGANTYTISVKYVGYAEEKATITVPEDKTVELNFQLKQAEVQLQEVVVTTSTVLPTEIKKLPNTITVVTEKEVEAINPNNVADLLRLTVPGFIYSQEGAGKSYAAFSVRGVSSVEGDASTLKVYIDGIEASDPAYVSYLDPSSIERVEVVPGPQASTIYGAGAISGVVQIFTKQGTEGATKLSGKVGAVTVDNKYVGNNTPLGSEVALNANGGFSFLTYNLGVNYQDEPKWLGNFSQNTFNWLGSTNFKFGDFSGGISTNISKTDGNSAENPLYQKMYSEIGKYYSSNSIQNSLYQNYGITLHYKATENWINNLTAGYNDLSYYSASRTPSTTTKLYSVTDSRTERYTASYNTSYQAKLSELFNGSVTLGTDWSQYAHPYYSASVPDKNNYTFTDQNKGYVINSGFYGQTLISYNEFLFLTGGLRADKNPSGADNSYTWSPRLGLSNIYELGDWLVKGRIAWGQSVIIPDASEVTGQEGSSYVILANPNLKSEIQKGWELGADLYYTNLFSFSVTYFNQKPTDLIETISLGTDALNRSIYQYQNVDEVKNEGIELKAVTNPFDWLKVNLNYGTTKSTITKLGATYTGTRKVGDQLTELPKYTASVNLEITPIEGTSFTLSAFQYGSWIGNDFYGYLKDVYSGNYSKSYPDDYLITYPSYIKINAGISQKITDKLNVYLQIHNLTNTDKFERLNLIVTQPRTIYFGLRFTGLTLQ